jgi:hypothetical protein
VGAAGNVGGVRRLRPLHANFSSKDEDDVTSAAGDDDVSENRDVRDSGVTSERRRNGWTEKTRCCWAAAVTGADIKEQPVARDDPKMARSAWQVSEPKALLMTQA